jgi:hypothetical protein
VDRAAVGVVGGVGDQLVIRGQGEILVDRIGIIRLENAFVAIVELAVADQKAETTRRQEIAVRGRQSVDCAADTEIAPDANDHIIDIKRRVRGVR